MAKVATRLRPYMPKNYQHKPSTAPDGSLLQRIEDILAANDIDAPVPEYITERQHYERYMEDMEEDV